MTSPLDLDIELSSTSSLKWIPLSFPWSVNLLPQKLDEQEAKLHL